MGSFSADPKRLSRRAFLGTGAAAAAGALAPGLLAAEGPGEGGILFGVLADCHYADSDTVGTRAFRDSAAKMAAFVRAMNEARPAFVVELGDLIDTAGSREAEADGLKRIEAAYRGFKGERHHVLGNHDVATFTKPEFIAATGMPGAHYAFDSGPHHFVVLDACYRQDGEPYAAGNFHWTDSLVPAAELKWLAADLRRAARPCVVFVHQTLNDEDGPHGVKNGRDVRRVLETSGKVVAVLQGHTHAAARQVVGGIPYVTLRGMVEGAGPDNNAYALVRVSAKGVAVRGFGKQPDQPA